MTHARVRTGMLSRIIGAGGLALLGAILLSVTSVFAQSSTVTLDAYLHGSGGTANPPTLTADLIPPLSLTAKTKDSAGLAFSGGNPWVTMGTWTPPAGINGKATLTALTTAHLWLGFKSSGDVGGKVDVLVEALVNGQVLSSGLTRCVSTLTASASTAQDISIALGSIPTTQLDTLTQTLAVRVSTRMGTTASNTACGTKASVTGVRAYFDALPRASRLGVTIALPPPQPVVLLPNPKTIRAGSTSAILARVRDLLAANVHSSLRADGPGLGLAELAAAARAGDKVAAMVIAETEESIGIGVADLVNVFDPGTVVLAGEVVSTLHGLMEDGIHRIVRRRAIHSISQRTRIVTSALDADSAALGAATMVIERLLGTEILNL